MENEPATVTAENAAPISETGNQAEIALAVAGTMPPVEQPAPAPAASPAGIFGFKRKRGRPRKNPFAAPVNIPENPAPNNSGAVPLPPGASPGLPGGPALPPPEPADYSAYGKAGASLVCGIYTIRGEMLRSECEKKLPKPLVDRCIDRLAVPDAIKSDLEAGYSAVAEELKLPARGGKLAQLLAGHANLEIHYRAMIRELISEIRKMADLKKEEKPAEQKPRVMPDPALALQ